MTEQEIFNALNKENTLNDIVENYVEKIGDAQIKAKGLGTYKSPYWCFMSPQAFNSYKPLLTKDDMYLSEKGWVKIYVVAERGEDSE